MIFFYVVVLIFLHSTFKSDLFFDGKIIFKASILGYGSIHTIDVRYYAKALTPDYHSIITFNQKNYPNYTDIHYVTGGYPAGYLPKKEYEYETAINIYKNVVCTTESVIISKHGFFLIAPSCHPRYTLNGTTVSLNYRYAKYDKVICLGHQHSHEWGHWSIEVLPALIALPEEFLKDSLIALPKIYNFIIDDLDFFGIESSRIIDGLNMPFYANTLITIDSVWCGDLNRDLILNMRSTVVRLLYLDRIEPFRYVLANRKSNMPRSISNFESIFNSVQRKYSSYNWEVFQFYPSFAEQVRYFNSFELLFAVHGSLLTNILYMKPNTMVIELQMEQWLLTFINIATMTGKIYVVGHDSRISYLHVANNSVPIKYVRKLIEKAFSLKNVTK